LSPRRRSPPDHMRLGPPAAFAPPPSLLRSLARSCPAPFSLLAAASLGRAGTAPHHDAPCDPAALLTAQSASRRPPPLGPVVNIRRRGLRSPFVTPGSAAPGDGCYLGVCLSLFSSLSLSPRVCMPLSLPLRPLAVSACNRPGRVPPAPSLLLPSPFASLLLLSSFNLPSPLASVFVACVLTALSNTSRSLRSSTMAKKKRAAAEAWDDAERNGMTPVAQSGINGDIVIKELLPYTEEQYGTLLKMWDECVLPDPVCRESWSVFADLAGAPLPGAIGTRGGILAPAPRPAYGKAFHGWPAEVFQMVPGHRPQQMGLVPRRMAAAA